MRVEQGMTLYSISRANGVTVAQLAAANGISPPYTVSTGRVLRIPGVAQARAPKPSFEPQDDFASDEPVKKASGGRHTVRGGETLFSLGRKYGVSPYAIADLNGLPHDQTLNVGQSLRLPGGNGASQLFRKFRRWKKASRSHPTTIRLKPMIRNRISR